MERVSCVQGALADQSVNTDLAFLLSSKHRVTQNLKHQPGPLGPAEEVLLVVTPEELVKFVQSGKFGQFCVVINKLMSIYFSSKF